ncbi:hypothetical protein UUU_26650 (plasmid) [Klebsiella pneumoniae subsp. pneumoniae DSM 30104 = JCM 1662 = NBRC 14940]|nr:hypothetical protein UUU_26650 [Klebsiella pneumoniae subsp. pneumoniae DSM 30104 = JCM 1662 = NBRC 14940]
MEYTYNVHSGTHVYHRKIPKARTALIHHPLKDVHGGWNYTDQNGKLIA